MCRNGSTAFQVLGGAQKLVTRCRSSNAGSCSGDAGPIAGATIVASAFHGTNRLLQECLAQPGEDTLRCRSPGSRPFQYMLDRWPTG